MKVQSLKKSTVRYRDTKTWKTAQASAENAKDPQTNEQAARKTLYKTVGSKPRQRITATAGKVLNKRDFQS